jgi:hypothetical protein
MFAHDLCISQVEYLRNSIDFNKKTERSDTTNRQYSIVNIQFGSGFAGLGFMGDNP